MNKMNKKSIILVATISLLLLLAASGAYSVTRFSSGIHVSDSRNANATGTPVLMVDGKGTGVVFEVRDSATPVFQIPDGGGVVMSSGIDLNGQNLIWDLDGDTISVTSLDDTITTTLGAATGKFHILTGNLAIGNGTNDVTLDGEDAYVEGTFEVDGLATLDGGTDYNGATVILDADADTTRQVSVDDIITYTLGAAAGRISILTGNLAVGNGSPTFTQDGEDVYIEGATELGGDVFLSPQTTFVVVMGVPITPTGYYQPMTTSVPGAGGLVSPIAAPTDDTTGKLLLLHNIDASDVITIDGTGATVECKADVILDAQDTLSLIWNGDDWVCISNFDNS